MNLNITSPVDSGVGFDTTPYNFSTNSGSTWIGWTGNTTYSLGTQNDPTYTLLRAKVRDSLLNESITILATGTWTNVAPTANAIAYTGTE